ncbi:MAG: efflux transporter outer membrane subunit [Nitrosomonas sp.]|nr:efflux transporter outer membrane subunit [Nitrosomonas sp.]
MNRVLLFLLFLFVLLLTACSGLTPTGNPLPETVSVPAQWRTASDATAPDVTRDWWRSFGNAELAQLVVQAQEQSLDVVAAVARVHQAEAAARIASAPLLPELSVNADFSRQGQYGDLAFHDHTFFGGLAASYEIDFWGKNRARRNAARAILRATEFDHDTVALTVTAGTAQLWLQTTALRQRIDIAERNLDNASRFLALVEARQRAGAATLLDVARQRGLAASQQRIVVSLRQQAGDSQTALAVLLGLPASFTVKSSRLDALRVPSIRAGLPSDLLVRRPDIARAEAQLVAANASIAAARAAMLPSLRLTASMGVVTPFDGPLYNAAAGLMAPLFNAGRLAAGRDLAIAQHEELLASYRSVIISAFGNVEVALNAVTGYDLQAAAQAQEQELAQAQRAFDLAESRYRAGAETLMTLLDVQRTLYAALDHAVQLKLLMLQARVSLFRALGGGWQVANTNPGVVL